VNKIVRKHERNRKKEMTTERQKPSDGGKEKYSALERKLEHLGRRREKPDTKKKYIYIHRLVQNTATEFVNKKHRN
jgi:hypothetical protein